MKVYAWRTILSRRDFNLGALAVRDQRAWVRQRRDLARLQLPLAAVHDPAAHGHGADPQLPAARRRRRPSARPGRTFRHFVIRRWRCPRSAARSSRSRWDTATTSRRSSSPEHAVHRQRRLRECRRRQQPARGSVRHGAGGDHDRVPLDRDGRPARSSRSMSKPMHLSSGNALAAAARDRAGIAFLYVPLLVIGPTRSTSGACRRGRSRA